MTQNLRGIAIPHFAHTKGNGKSIRAKLIALLQTEPVTVDQICKRLDISAAHARTDLRNVDAKAGAHTDAV